MVLTNENAQVFLCKEISKGIVSTSYLVKVSSIAVTDKSSTLLTCSFRSFCDAVDKTLYDAILSGKHLLSKQTYDLMMQSFSSISLDKQRITVQFMIVHRKLITYSLYFVGKFSENWCYVLNQEYEAEYLGEKIMVYRCEVVQSPSIINYPSILQDENKLLPGATYQVENALKEGNEIVIDSQSTISFVHAPTIPPKVHCLSVSEALRSAEDKPIWMIGRLMDYSFVRAKEKCLTLIQDCSSKEVIEFWSGGFIQRFTIGQTLVFADISLNNKEKVYSQNSFVFCYTHPYPFHHYETLSPLAFSYDYYSWQVIDVVYVQSVKVQLVCPCCQQQDLTNCSCSSERTSCKQICLINFDCVLNGKILSGVLRGDAGFRWMNLPEEVHKEILKHIQLRNKWFSEMSSVFSHSTTRKMLGRVKMLARRPLFRDFIFAIDIESVDLQVILENKLSQLLLNELDPEAVMKNKGL